MVDKFISYSDDAGTVSEAFAFVMEHMDEFSAPSIAIQAYTSYHNLSEMAEDGQGELRFGVSVSGSVE